MDHLLRIRNKQGEQIHGAQATEFVPNYRFVYVVVRVLLESAVKNSFVSVVPSKICAKRTVACGTMEDRGWVPAASETGLGLKFVTRCSYGAHSQSPFLFRFSGMFAWSNRVAVFELFFVMCFLSRFPPNDHVYSCVLAMNCYDLFHVLGQQIHNSTHPSGLDPAARGPEARCVPPHPLIA